MNLCTVMIPSRGRVSELFRCIESISCSAVGGEWNIAIRIDDDDDKSTAVIPQLEAYPWVKVSVGPRPVWSHLDSQIYTVLANQADSQWVWIMNDDMTIEGKGWDEQLDKVPLTGYWCEPEVHQLNASRYPRDPRGCAPLFVNGCWKTLGIGDNIAGPSDYVMPTELENRGWKPWFLEGITVWHQRNK